MNLIENMNKNTGIFILENMDNGEQLNMKSHSYENIIQNVKKT